MTRTEKNAEEIRERTHLSLSWHNPKAKIIFSMKFQLILSKDLDRSNFRIIPGVLVGLRV